MRQLLHDAGFDNISIVDEQGRYICLSSKCLLLARISRATQFSARGLIELIGSVKSKVYRVIKISLESLLIQLATASIILSSMLWIVGKQFAIKDNVKFTDALWMGVLGVILSTVIGLLLSGWVAILTMIPILLVLIKHLFECGWREGFAISISSWILYWVMTLILLPPILS